MIKEQFELNKLGLVHEDPEDFSICCWQRTRRILPVWVAYRAVVFGYFFASTLYAIISWMTKADISREDRPKMFIYLTVWTYFLETFMFFWGLLVVVVDYVKQHRGTDDETPSLIAKVFWVLYTMVLPCALLVTLIFWTAVYDNKYFSLTASNVMMHVTNSAFLLVDFCLVAFPYRFLHAYIPNFYLEAYVIFSVIYECSGGTGMKDQRPIYEILDWTENPYKSFVHVMLCCMVALVVHILFSFLYLLKLWLRKRYVI